MSTVPGCVTASRAEEIAREEYRRAVLHPARLKAPAFPNCDAALEVITDEQWNGYRVSVFPRDDCLGDVFLDADGKYFVWRCGHISRQ